MPQHNSPATCAKCHTTVAPFDPERIQMNLSVYHGKCFKLLQSKEDYAKASLIIKKYHFMSDGLG